MIPTIRTSKKKSCIFFLSHRAILPQHVTLLPPVGNMSCLRQEQTPVVFAEFTRFSFSKIAKKSKAWCCSSYESNLPGSVTFHLLFSMGHLVLHTLVISFTKWIIERGDESPEARRGAYHHTERDTISLTRRSETRAASPLQPFCFVYHRHIWIPGGNFLPDSPRWFHSTRTVELLCSPSDNVIQSFPTERSSSRQHRRTQHSHQPCCLFSLVYTPGFLNTLPVSSSGKTPQTGLCVQPNTHLFWAGLSNDFNENANW